MDRDALLREVARRVPVHGEETVLVAVDGADGAGKSIFAAEVAHAVRDLGRPVIQASVDGFHRPRSQRYLRGRDSPTGFWLDSYDYGRLRAELIDPLRPGGSGLCVTAVHDVDSDRFLDPVPAVAAAGSVLVLDGLFLHRDELRGLWDFSVYLDVPLAVSVARLASRDGSVNDPESPTLRRYVEAQRIYHDACSPLQRATVIVDNTDLADPFIR